MSLSRIINKWIKLLGAPGHVVGEVAVGHLVAAGVIPDEPLLAAELEGKPARALARAQLARALRDPAPLRRAGEAVAEVGRGRGHGHAVLVVGVAHGAVAAVHALRVVAEDVRRVVVLLDAVRACAGKILSLDWYTVMCRENLVLGNIK